MISMFFLGLFLSLLLRHLNVGELDGSGNEFNNEQQMDNAGPMVLQDPFLYYLDYKTVYVNCSVYGESPFEVSWLYSTDEISNRSSGYTIISGSKVSNIVYNPNSDDEGYVWWNSSLLLNPINNSTVGYYYCRVNTSFGLNYSKPVYVRNTSGPMLISNNTSLFKKRDLVNGSCIVKSFPQPNILVSFQTLFYISSGTSTRVYHNYDTANISHNHYVSSHLSLYVNKEGDDIIRVNWSISFSHMFSMQLIAISYNSTSNVSEYHKLYTHTGHTYAHILQLSAADHIITLSCICAECDDIQWRRNNKYILKTSYGVASITKELWPYYSINLKHSTYSISFDDLNRYACSSVSNEDDIFDYSFSVIESPFAVVTKNLVRATKAPGETLSLDLSAQSLYKMTAKWMASRYIEGGWNEYFTNRRDGDLFVMNTNFSFKVALTTPGSFVVNCTVRTFFFIQLRRDITASYYLYKRGALFAQSLKTLSSYSTADIEIQFPSSINSNITQLIVNETDRIHLWCHASGVPQPLITWYHRNERLINSNILTLTNFQTELIIINLNRERDEGTYTCQAKNNVTNLINATDSHNITVHIQVAPEIILSSNFTASDGESINVTVTVVKAHPLVLPDHISWTCWTTASNGSVVIPSNEKRCSDNINISEDGRSLYISDLTSDDEGYYQVLIWHPAGYKNKTTYLKITEIPTTEGEEETSYQYVYVVGTAVGLLVLTIITGIVIISIIAIAYKTKRNGMNQMIFNGRRRSSALSNTAEIHLDAVDPNFMKVIPLILLIKRSNLKLLDCIGQGEFAKVYKGHYYINGECSLVAVKALKGTLDRYSSESMKELIEESLVMKDLQHPNVMGLIGICLDAGPSPLIVLPYMEGGSLLKYLVKNREILITFDSTDVDEINQVCSQLLSICLQIGKGMQYIKENDLIHRDLAARNCMIDAVGNVKVADFGLSKDVSGNVYFRQQMSSGVKLPIKWMAIESIEDGIFTEKTDIWSFGITVWEVFNGGKTPYGGFSPTCVKTMISDGYRLEAPSNSACNDDIYQKTMLKCWERDPNERPTFAQVVTDIDRLLSNSVGYLDLTL